MTEQTSRSTDTTPSASTILATCTVAAPVSQRRNLSGFVHGGIGVLMFSATLPMTRLGVMEMNAFFLTFGRATIAGLCAIVFLMLSHAPWPKAEQWRSLVLVALGVVVGFPLFSSLAVQHVSAAHSLVFTALLPLSTAIFAVLRAGERPTTPFWLFAGIGSLLIVFYALRQGFTASPAGDLYMVAAIVLGGLGYAEGAFLARRMGGARVISWALILALPVMLLAMLAVFPSHPASISMAGWGALAYVSFFSMFIGFFFWYRGLAEGGIAAVGQLQLLQPFFGLALAAFVFHEQIDPLMLVISLLLIICVFGAREFA